MSIQKPKCSHEGCNKDASKRVLMRLYISPRQKPSLTEYGLYCEEHANLLKRSDVFSKEKWNSILQHFRKLRLPPPIQKYSDFKIETMEYVQ